jgi:streptogramin lyase
MKAGVVFLALLAALSGAPPPAFAQDVASGVTVSTFSGSGAAGFADGSANAANYVMPSALAYDTHGYLYVVDSAAQRIRRVDNSGTVVTIAGSGELHGLAVDGGYVDGPGSQAKFSTPSGIAIAHSGTIYVSDTYNHCIRAISPSGLVTTYAGTPSQPGYADGPRASARFSRPLGLALDKQENLYVADADIGIREIETKTGTVRTLPLAVFSPFNLAILPGRNAASSLIVVADAQGIKYIDGDRRGQFDLIDQFANFKMYELPPYHQLTQGARPLGNPYGLTAIGNHTIAFTDLRGDSVRTLDLDSHALSILAGPGTEDAGLSGGGNQDGPGATARFGAPMGIAMSATGDLAIADAGSRRIRMLRGLVQRTALSPADLAMQPNTNAPKYRIGYVGNSSIWWDTDWSSSIASGLETSLASDAALEGTRPAEVLPIYLPQSKLSESMEYLQGLVRGRTLDAVVLQINSGSVLGDLARLGPANSRELSDAPQVWAPALTQSLRSLDEACRQNGVALLVVVHPLPWELAPNESLMYGMLGGDIIPDSAMEPAFTTAVNASGARMLDLWPAFLTALKQPHRAALFGSYDFHFTKYGRSVAARAIADELMRWAPWKR